MTQKRDGRRGDVFPMRITPDQRAELERLQLQSAGPRALGPFILWRAMGNSSRTRVRVGTAVIPLVPNTPIRRRIILDLCAGSGSWSEPYRRAGYQVLRVTLPKTDVRTFVPPSRVWGVLAAPPCNEFSPAKRGARDFVEGMACVNACLRIIMQCRPTWWALENPVGKLSIWLGPPSDFFEPCDFGDPWTKRTALWGTFALPHRGPFVKPACGKLSIARDARERAVTPQGFARAFFRSNP
jgi:hypothetical protein